MRKIKCQRERILDYLKNGNSLMRLEAWEKLGVVEAPARISEIRALGHKVKTTMITVNNKYGERVRVAKWSIETS